MLIHKVTHLKRNKQNKQKRKTNMVTTLTLLIFGLNTRQSYNLLLTPMTSLFTTDVNEEQIEKKLTVSSQCETITREIDNEMNLS